MQGSFLSSLAPVPFTRLAIVNHCLLATLLLAGGCRCREPEPAERQILKLVERAVELAEKKSVADLLELTTDDFLARPGNHDRRQTRRLLAFYLLRHRQVTILHPRPEIELGPEGTSASVRLVFLLLRSGRPPRELDDLQDDLARWAERAAQLARLHKLVLQLRREDGDWLVQQASLKRFKLSDLTGG